MSIRINSLDKIKRRLNIQDGGPAHAFFTETCYKKMNKFVPMSAENSRGNLRGNVDIKVDSITYESPYASYQYFGKRKDGSHVIRNWTTPGTGPKWDKRMISADMNEVVKEVGQYIRTHGGGK